MSLVISVLRSLCAYIGQQVNINGQGEFSRGKFRVELVREFDSGFGNKRGIITKTRQLPSEKHMRTPIITSSSYDLQYGAPWSHRLPESPYQTHPQWKHPQHPYWLESSPPRSFDHSQSLSQTKSISLNTLMINGSLVLTTKRIVRELSNHFNIQSSFFSGFLCKD